MAPHADEPDASRAELPRSDSIQSSEPEAPPAIESQSPLESQVPPSVVATPSDVGAAPWEDVEWWQPTWADAVRYVGWRWVLLSPALLVLGLLGLGIWRASYLQLFWAGGAHLTVFMIAVAVSMAGYVIRKATRARRDPFCIHCGYNLSGLPDDHRCPECGRPYNFRLIDEYRRDPLWFKERWKLLHHLPASSAPFDAGKVRRKRSRDGT